MPDTLVPALGLLWRVARGNRRRPLATGRWLRGTAFGLEEEGRSSWRQTVTLTVKGGRLDGKEYTFNRPVLCTIGRGLDCGVRLTGGDEVRTVSRRHCRLAVEPPRVRVWDCGSHNGTCLNGMQIGRPAAWMFPANIAARPCAVYELHDGDELEVGGVVLRVRVKSTLDTCPQHHAGLPEDKGLCVCG